MDKEGVIPNSPAKRVVCAWWQDDEKSAFAIFGLNKALSGAGVPRILLTLRELPAFAVLRKGWGSLQIDRAFQPREATENPTLHEKLRRYATKAECPGRMLTSPL